MKRNLQGKEQLDRMKQMMNEMSGSESTPTTLLKSREASNGNNYGVIKENNKYYIMESHDGGYRHIDGFNNKENYEYRSYSAALKNMNLLFSSINEVHNHKDGINLFEGKRYVIRTPKTEQEETQIEPPTEVTPPKPTVGRPGLVRGSGQTQPPVEKPISDVPAETTDPNMGGEMDFDSEVETTDPNMGGEMDFDSEVSSIEKELGGGEVDIEKEIQSLTGQLGQALRQGEQTNIVDPELTKYVVNSVFSALNLGELSNEDKLGIIKKVKNSGNEGEMGLDSVGDEPMDLEMPMDGLDSGMGDELEIPNFDDIEEDVLYGDGVPNEDDLTKALKSFVQKTVNSYIEEK